MKAPSRTFRLYLAARTRGLAGYPRLDSHFTGVWERFEAEKTREQLCGCNRPPGTWLWSAALRISTDTWRLCLGTNYTGTRTDSLCLFRVLQEALQNAVKHSGVRHFKVELHGASEEIQLTLSDLGAGFDERDANNHEGLGLISMRERLQLVNGEFSVNSQPGCGTTISARVALKRQKYRASVVG